MKKTAAEQFEELGDALRKFLEEFAKSLRLYELLDWITVRLERRRVLRIVRRCLEEGRKVVIPKAGFSGKLEKDTRIEVAPGPPERVDPVDPTFFEPRKGPTDHSPREGASVGAVVGFKKEGPVELTKAQVADAIARMPENDARLLCSLALIRLVDLGYGEKDLLAWLAADLEETIATKKEHDAL